MEFSEQELADLEMLARVELSESEWNRCRQAFQNVLDLAASLQAIDTEEVEPMISPIHLMNVMREDEIRPGLEREEALAQATETESGCFKVPRIL